MSTEQLGRLEDLPADYLRVLTDLHLTPLWPSLRDAVPALRPTRRATPTLWRYLEVREALLRAGSLTPLEKAERRVLALCNPGFGGAELRATATIYIGLQLILPSEGAPNHRHSPSAIRFVVEGRGAYTVVDGEKLPMEKGDLILTPSWHWHEHRHEGVEPVIWLDALDLPIIYGMEASYSISGASQTVTDIHNVSSVKYRNGGVVPYQALNREPTQYPVTRFPWSEVRDRLEAIAAITDPTQPVHLAYVNPETGRECLPSLGFSALRVAAGTTTVTTRRSASAVLHVVEGEGSVHVDENGFNVREADTVAVPTHATLRMTAGRKAPLMLFMVDDAPIQRKLGIYEEFEAATSPQASTAG